MNTKNCWFLDIWRKKSINKRTAGSGYLKSESKNHWFWLLQTPHWLPGFTKEPAGFWMVNLTFCTNLRTAVIYQNRVFDFLGTLFTYSNLHIFLFLRTAIINPKNHPDTQWGFGAVSNNHLTWVFCQTLRYGVAD
jgi:hypothetical protein